MARDLVGEGEFLEVFVDAPLAVVEARDPKGLYKKARAGEIKNFTGIDSPYEPPLKPDIRLDTTAADAEELAERVVERLRRGGYLGLAVTRRLTTGEHVDADRLDVERRCRRRGCRARSGGGRRSGRCACAGTRQISPSAA